VVTFDGFNELDSFVASAVINRAPGATALITTPTPLVTSLNGVEVHGQRPLEFVADADAVLIGSGIRTHDVVADDRLVSALALDPRRQLIGSQCSGALVLARLGLVDGVPVCTDATSRPFVEACGVAVLDAPFHAEGAIATAGGCLASQYLAAWGCAAPSAWRRPRRRCTTWRRSGRRRPPSTASWPWWPPSARCPWRDQAPSCTSAIDVMRCRGTR